MISAGVATVENKKCHGSYDEQIWNTYLKGIWSALSKLLKTNNRLKGIYYKGKTANETSTFGFHYDMQLMESPRKNDRLIFEKPRELGSVPTTLNFDGYPKSIVSSED